MLTTLVAAQMLWTLSDAVVQLRDGDNGLNAMRNLQAVLATAELASKERGPSNGILGDDLPHDPKKLALLNAAREKTDAAFAELNLAFGHTATGASELQTLLTNAQQQLRLGRHAIDTIAGLPRSQRAPEQIRDAILGMFLVIDDLAPAELLLTNTAQAIYPGQTNFLLAARSAADLREYAGRLGSHFTVALTKREKIEMAELTAIEQLTGRIAQLHAALLERVQGRQDDPAVAQATAAMEHRFFDTAMPYVRAQLAIGLGDAQFPTDAAGFAKRYVPDMDSIIDLRNTLIGEALQSAQAKQAQSRTTSHFIVFWTVTALLLLVAILFFLEFRISRPLRQAIQLILDIAHGRLDVTMPYLKYQDEMREVVMAIAVLRDNALARKQAESLLEEKSAALYLAHQALLETAADLEHRVAERTTALRDALQTARSANEAKSRFLALMSHEIRTPMNGVLGLAELMRTTPLDAQQSLYVKNILNAGSALSALINDILDFSKIEAGEMALELLVFDPRAVVSETVDFMQTEAAAKSLDVTLRLTDPLPPLIRSDPTRMRQILLNLIGNAIKFTAQGRVTVSLEATPDTLMCTVQDSGIGMSADTIAGLFEPFRQADSSTARKFGGTGLGLVICKALVEKMQGQLQVNSLEGQGSSFSFTLPLTGDEATLAPPPSDDADASRGATTASAAEPAPDLSNLRILLVDDQPINRLMASNQLKQLGCTLIEEAHNGLQALQRLRAAPFDVVLMDMQMPEMDGLEATRALRQLPLDKQPTVIAMTANAFSEDRQACMDAGMDDFLAKPVKLDTLKSALQNMTAPL